MSYVTPVPGLARAKSHSCQYPMGLQVGAREARDEPVTSTGSSASACHQSMRSGVAGREVATGRAWQWPHAGKGGGGGMATWDCRGRG